MKHRKLMIPCAIIAVIALTVLATNGSTSFGVGIGLVLVLCPLLMGTMMWMLMRQPKAPAAQDPDRTPEAQQ